MRRFGSVMNDAALGVILMLLGGMVARICVTGEFLNYVKPSTWPLLVIASVALMVIGAVTVRLEFGERASRKSGSGSAGRGTSRDEQSASAAHAHDHATQELARTVSSAHDEHAHTPGVAWLLLAPALVLALVAPPALGADAAALSGTTLTDRGDYPPLPEGDPVSVRLSDYASRAAFDPQSLDGRRVELTGFVSNGSGGQVYLVRMMVTCCAADGRPVKVGLSGDASAGLSNDTWVSVVGHYSPTRATDEINGATIPFVEIESLTPVPTPENPYDT